MAAAERARALRLMGFDVDGVLTDGMLYYTSVGDEMKAFSVRDGHGLKMLREAGVEPVIITGRRSRALELRAENLGIATLLQGVEDKRAAMAQLLAARSLEWRQCGYMGDDVVDLPVLRACGFAATVPDGHALVKQHVHYVAQLPAGRGAVREVCEFILRARGALDAALEPYLA
ncbi:MAG: phenylphosphate carboxylase subunit delta [Pseudomonadota bacterium]|jgi:3-deoxy-D-manno-octulosonate 8-phosphate phosphatase (KDO 8-P phosphatase)